MNIIIVGTGLIGGSLALEIKRKFSDVNIIGVDINIQSSTRAKELGIIDRITDLNVAIGIADVILLAVPVDVISDMLPSVLDTIGENVIVIDTGSTKKNICEIVKNHPKRSQFVTAHPIAGTENSGPEAACLDLFKGKKCILCEIEKNDKRVLDFTIRFLTDLGMELRYMTSEDHDKHMAIVSHLSHISSFALALTVLKMEINDNTIADLAGSGFDSTVRLAKSSPMMWTSIIQDNSEYIENALNEYIQQLIQFRNYIKLGDSNELNGLIMGANKIKRILDE